MGHGLLCILGHDAVERGFCGIREWLRRIKTSETVRRLFGLWPRWKEICTAGLAFCQNCSRWWDPVSLHGTSFGSLPSRCPFQHGYNNSSICIRPPLLLERQNRHHQANGEGYGINAIFQAWGWRTSFGHSFRIGGPSFYLAQGKNPEHIRTARRWNIHSFELIANRHLSDRPTSS